MELHLVGPYTSRGERHRQRREVKRLLDVEQAGWREVLALTRSVMDRCNSHETGAVLAEVRAHFHDLVHIEKGQRQQKRAQAQEKEK
jgi:hypothetical protein